MIDITKTLARYAVASSYEALPESVRREGARAFVNWVGCAAAGSREEPVDIVARVFGELHTPGETTVVGRREKVGVLEAAFINAMSANVLMFHDTHYVTVAHPTAPVAAALVALAQHRVISGRDLLHALVLGIEIQCRVGLILTAPPAEAAVGLSMGGLVGAIGAAVAAGKALALDDAAMTTAVGLAANQAAGLRQAHATMANHYTPAQAARCGLLSALLAASGFTASDTMIEGPHGFAVSYAASPNFEAAIDGLGARFEIASLAYKPYPSGFVSHPVIDACLDIASRPGFDAAGIERVELSVNPLAAKLMDRPNPRSRDEAVGSMQHWAAAALIYKEAGIAQTREAATTDARVCALRSRVTLRSNAAIDRTAAEVRLTLKGGGVLEARVLHCRGSAGRPMSDADITEKTRAQLLVVFDGVTAEHVLGECWRMERYPNAGELCRQLGAR